MAGTNKYDSQHRRNQAAYERRVEDIFRTAAREAARLGLSIKDYDPARPFSFSDYPATRRKIEKLLSDLQAGIEAVIVDGIRSEWALSNDKNDELARQVLGEGADKLAQAQQRRYFSRTEAARDTFIKRKEGGLGLSDRVWRYTEQFKEEIELGLDIGIRSGRSADELSRDLRSYLQHPDKLFRRVRNEHGQLVLSRRAKAYHPGRGVYRSSYKNARRLAATETNIAYMTADYERWQQLDFVVGIEIKLSCHVVTILKTEEELAADARRILAGQEPAGESANRVTDVPEGFKDWMDSNAGRISVAASRGTLPYFIRDNHRAAITTYARYKTNEDYIGAALNYLTWGVKATHRGHNFDKRKGWYETAVQDAGYNAGHRVILEDEPQDVYKKKSCEGLWDGRKFEVAGAETATPNNIRNALKHCASKPDCEVAVVFFPSKESASMEAIRSGISKYTGLEHTRQYRKFARIFFIAGKEIVHSQ